MPIQTGMRFVSPARILEKAVRLSQTILCIALRGPGPRSPACGHSVQPGNLTMCIRSSMWLNMVASTPFKGTLPPHSMTRFALNTYHPSSLYEALEPGEARRIAEKLEIHYTPKHGSRERIGGAGRPVLGLPDPQPGRPETRNSGLARTTKPRWNMCHLAFHHSRCTNQTQVPIPINTTVLVRRSVTAT